MNILICISVVPDTTSKINFIDSNKKFDQNGITFIINPLDEFCLTKAIFIKEKNGANITVLNVGKAENDPILRKALAIGADRAIRIDAESNESLSVATLIANHIKNEKYDIIFCGKESIDYNGGKIPGFLSSILNIPFINACVGLELENELLITKNEIDDGIQTCTCKKPIIVAGQKGLVEEKDLKIPSMRGIMTARTKPLEIITAESIENENIKTIGFELPKEKEACKMVDAENVHELIELLQNEAKVL
tara:strand:+ start:242 stop:991 length:750 start_codon:yes stop_codon:yes gene_type:complete